MSSVRPVSEIVGSHFIVGLSGPVLSSQDVATLETLKPAGVILRAHNIDASLPYAEWLDKLALLEQGVRRYTGRSHAIIAIDHEGGRIHRLPPPITHFPSAQRYAAQASAVGRAMAVELRSIGVNLDFAPVADIHSNPQNPVIGVRSFGAAPLEVAAAATKFAQALLEEDVVPVAKHFPGHGDTSQDSHEELPVLDISADVLRSREFVPFQALIRQNIPAILTAHVRFPQIDSDYPATLSPLVLRSVLREELGFSGIIISDDLDMKAVANNFSDEEVAFQAFLAGVDLLLFNHDPERAVRVARLAEELLDQCTLDPEDFSASSQRVQRFLSDTISINRPELLSADILHQHAALAKTLVGSAP